MVVQHLHTVPGVSSNLTFTTRLLLHCPNDTEALINNHMEYKNFKVIKIHDISNYILIDWVLGNYCNYNCSYCFPGSNSGNIRPPKITESIESNISHLVSEIKKISNKQIVFSLGGGEPTLYHDLTRLLEILNQYGTVIVITNGSRTIEWWSNHYEYFHTVLISFHVETNNFNHILNLLKFLSGRIPKVILHVMIFDKMFEECIAVYNAFINELNEYSISIIPKVIRDVKNTFVNFTVDQHSIIENLTVASIPAISPIKPQYKSTRAYLENGEIVPIKIHNIKDLTGSVSGYKCTAHLSVIQINTSGELGRLSCGMQVYDICNIFLEDFIKKFKIKTTEIECTKETCGCTHLVLSTKHI
jgi:organic radical activating enzyme